MLLSLVGRPRTVALTRMGTVILWGAWAFKYRFGIASEFENLLATAICCGGRHAAALTQAGTVVCWGPNFAGQCTVPSGLEDVVAVCCGERHTVAVSHNGTISCWGDNSYNQCSVPEKIIVRTNSVMLM
jgi:alpha-tubulin suppressor-like RCC1 family protein